MITQTNLPNSDLMVFVEDLEIKHLLKTSHCQNLSILKNSLFSDAYISRLGV